MKWTLSLVVTALVLVPLVLAASAPAATTRACSSVAFTPNSDDLASSVRATGVSCRSARAFIRASDGRPGRRFRGFTCTSRRGDSALESRRYRCVSGAKRISWTRT